MKPTDSHSCFDLSSLLDALDDLSLFMRGREVARDYIFDSLSAKEISNATQLVFELLRLQEIGVIKQDVDFCLLPNTRGIFRHFNEPIIALSNKAIKAYTRPSGLPFFRTRQIIGSLNRESTLSNGAEIIALCKPQQFTDKGNTKFISNFRLVFNHPGASSFLISVLVVSILIETLGLLIPLHLQIVIDHGVASRDRNLIYMLSGAFLAIFIVQSIATLARTSLISWFSSALAIRGAQGLYKKIAGVRFEEISKIGPGGYLTAFTSQQAVLGTISNNAVAVGVDVMVAIGAIALMFHYNWKLSVIACMGIFCVVCIRVLRKKRISQARERALTHGALQQTLIIDSILGSVSIKVNDRIREFSRRFESEISGAIWQNYSFQLVTSTLTQAVILIGAWQRALIILVGALAAYNAEMTIGVLVAFVSYADMLAGRVSDTGERITELTALGPHYEKVAVVTKLEGEITNSPVFFPNTQLTPRLSVESVAFEYEGSTKDRQVLQNCSFHIDPGECVGITGKSGSGKTTLMKLILGLMEPTSGSITLDGCNLKAMGRSQWRSWVGGVLQDDSIFTGSIGENISCFDHHPNPEQIRRAAKEARISDVIESLENGYAEKIDSSNPAVSSGQRQRLFLARVMYRKCRVVILDEATSNLDLENEDGILKMLRNQEVSVLIISHRESAFKYAARVYSLENGVLTLNDAAE